MIVTLGSACRPGFQIKNYCENKSIRPIAYPFDWTITPFDSLKKVMDPSFDISVVLKDQNLEVNKAGSITDKATGIIHHHDFHPKEIRNLYSRDENPSEVPAALFRTNLIDNAKGRFVYAYNNMAKLRKCSNKIAFIRWQRRGHPDREFNNLFENETHDSLGRVIHGFLGNENFIIVTIETWEVAGALAASDIISTYEKKPSGISVVLKERKGFDGDGTNNYKGDRVSWQALFESLIREENLSLL